VKKFENRESHYRNIAQLINHKSEAPKMPSLSPYRTIEHRRTSEHFSSQSATKATSQRRDPNPITGIGYARDQGLGSANLSKTAVILREDSPKPWYFN
jgi:hypothetical protein